MKRSRFQQSADWLSFEGVLCAPFISLSLRPVEEVRERARIRRADERCLRDGGVTGGYSEPEVPLRKM